VWVVIFPAQQIFGCLLQPHQLYIVFRIRRKTITAIIKQIIQFRQSTSRKSNFITNTYTGYSPTPVLLTPKPEITKHLGRREVHYGIPEKLPVKLVSTSLITTDKSACACMQVLYLQLTNSKFFDFRTRPSD
jgi:hypothetical protein